MKIPTQLEDLHGVIVDLESIGLNNCLQLGVRQNTVVRRIDSKGQFSPPEHSKVVHTPEEALTTNPEFVIVATPSQLHAFTAIESSEAGCHALIEKPLERSIRKSEARLAASTETIDRICAMADL